MLDEKKDSLNLDILEMQDQEAVKNTYYRYPRVTPHINKFADFIEIKTIDHAVKLYKLDEVILYIIADFKFAPVWLIQQWCEDFNKNGYNMIENWIRVGIVWAQPSSVGVFLRPTKFLFELFEIDKQFYIDIPFNLLNHTCAEEQITFDVMMGNPKSEFWNVIKNDKMLPCYHPLNIKVENDSGTLIIREANFAINRFDHMELLRKNDLLKKDISTGKPFTAEFNDFSLFPIITFDDKNRLDTQKPDNIIPIPRIDGQAQSYAIELELTAKDAKRYNQIMKNYKNNLVFGKLFYLCANPRISRLVTEAFNEVGGLGTCKLYVIPYTAPAQRLSNYTHDDEESQKTILKISLRNTKKGT